MPRARLFVIVGYAVLTTWWSCARNPHYGDETLVSVYKNVACVCCERWVEHLKADGFRVRVEDTSSVEEIKRKYGIPTDLSSCHTAVVQGYVIEGHVPGDLIAKLIIERPQVRILAVPGMPIGSPGMEEGEKREPYEVVAIASDGLRYIFASR